LDGHKLQPAPYRGWARGPQTLDDFAVGAGLSGIETYKRRLIKRKFYVGEICRLRRSKRRKSRKRLLELRPKTVQGILRHEDFRTTMQLYAQSDMEAMREAQGKFLEQLLGDRIHLLTETVQ
jgi:integrase